MHGRIVLMNMSSCQGDWGTIQGRRISNSQQFEQIGVVPRDFEAFSLDSALGGFVLFEQIEGDAVEHGEVLSRVASAFAALILAEGHVSTQCSLFSMPQCWWITEFSRAASALRLVM